MKKNNQVLLKDSVRAFKLWAKESQKILTTKNIGSEEEDLLISNNFDYQAIVEKAIGIFKAEANFKSVCKNKDYMVTIFIKLLINAMKEVPNEKN